MEKTVITENLADLQVLYRYNVDLLKQMVAVIDILQAQAPVGFNYAQAVGPHCRHVLEHYSALLNTLKQESVCVDYDARERNLAVQNVYDVTRSKIQDVIDQIEDLAMSHHKPSDYRLQTRLKAGLTGDDEFVTESTLGRELLFLSSHTVHHFALISRYCKDAGVDLGHDFGKAPSTIAFERKARATLS